MGEMSNNPRADASWICCPMCDMDFETPKGKCPGYQNCQEITRYLRDKETEDKTQHERRGNGQP